MSKVYVGIDPGKSGGIATIHNDVIRAWPMPVDSDGNVCVHSAWNMFHGIIINERTDGDIRVFMEKTNAVYQSSAKSMYSFGRQVMAVEAVVICAGLSLELIRPKEWMNKILVGYPKKDKKDKPSIRYCQLKYPNVSLIPEGKRTPKDGMSDAICIAEYGKLKYA